MSSPLLPGLCLHGPCRPSASCRPCPPCAPPAVPGLLFSLPLNLTFPRRGFGTCSPLSWGLSPSPARCTAPALIPLGLGGLAGRRSPLCTTLPPSSRGRIGTPLDPLTPEGLLLPPVTSPAPRTVPGLGLKSPSNNCPSKIRRCPGSPRKGSYAAKGVTWEAQLPVSGTFETS